MHDHSVVIQLQSAKEGELQLLKEERQAIFLNNDDTNPISPTEDELLILRGTHVNAHTWK
jgi:hypothetical protein